MLEQPALALVCLEVNPFLPPDASDKKEELQDSWRQLEKEEDEVEEVMKEIKEEEKKKRVYDCEEKEKEEGKDFSPH